MSKGVRAAAVTFAALAALTLAGSAAAAYTSPKLQVTAAGTRTTIDATAAATDDATAQITVYSPAGLTATLTQAPGTVVGQVRAQVSALALGGALLPLAGEIRVAAPGQVPPTQSTPCLRGATPTTTWLLVLQAAGQTLNVPLYVIAAAGPETAFASYRLQACFTPPDVPEQVSCASTFCSKILRANLAVSGVFACGRRDLAFALDAVHPRHGRRQRGGHGRGSSGRHAGRRLGPRPEDRREEAGCARHRHGHPGRLAGRSSARDGLRRQDADGAAAARQRPHEARRHLRLRAGHRRADVLPRHGGGASPPEHDRLLDAGPAAGDVRELERLRLQRHDRRRPRSLSNQARSAV